MSVSVADTKHSERGALHVSVGQVGVGVFGWRLGYGLRHGEKDKSNTTEKFPDIVA